MIQVNIPENICFGNREKVLAYIKDNGIDTSKEWYITRDFDTGNYIVVQEGQSE